ncbi:MAG: bifunctional UDP-N-acetylglucosamine diphosphorylase/glucosamine-1-phosphate N-acetyltransferase GlmU [Gammaproteobacteria bacterium]|nr:bifunctional UDP-N-acetylglucosamine diphosphorylase/glucosamine-1-phosphate N-acetyltransferase GlmU [Gammaproteobacteria bacterium]
MTVSIIVLAAGQGTRMRSQLPKVLQPLAGRPLLDHVLDTAQALDPRRLLVVHGHGADAVRETCDRDGVDWVLQAEQLGTGHAVDQAMPEVSDEDIVLVLYGDVPLITRTSLDALLAATSDSTLGLLTIELDDPAGYGRILRNTQGRIERIVEHKDATDKERDIREINTGLLAAPAEKMKRWLRSLDNRNAQGEYYLTDIIAMSVAEGMEVVGVAAQSAAEVHGINDRSQLAAAEAMYRERQAQALMQQGVHLLDPARIDIRGELSCGLDVQVDVNVVFEGKVTLADGVRIGPNCVLRDVTVGKNTVIDAFSHIESADIGKSCSIGPYARLRPGSLLKDDVKVGNFVEIKKSELARGAKVNHLTYIGDASIGEVVNIGAGTITCNYDGVNKHRTVIEDGAFIGSNASLVAPVRVGRNATVGAGSVISKDVGDDALAVTRARQSEIADWQRPTKK